MVRTTGLVLVAMTLLASSVAVGQEANGRAERLAYEHYERSREFFGVGRYEDARVELERALELDPDSAVLVYNLGRVHEELANYDQAIRYYEQYLSRSTLASDERLRIERTIERLRGASQHGVRGQDGNARGVADATFWTLLATGGAMLIAGATTGGLALARESTGDDFVLGIDGTAEDRLAQQETARRLAMSSDILLSAGAVTTTVALLLYGLRRRPSEYPSASRRLRLDVVTGDGQLGVMLQGNL